MSGNDSKENIQEMEKGEKDLGILDSAQSLHKKIVSNQLVSEFDVFSVPVKLTLNGQDVYQTCCGGIMYLLLIAFCIILTIFVLFPNGVKLNSYIDVVVVPTDQGDTGQTLFDHTDQVMGIRGIRKNGTRIVGYTNLSGLATFTAYQVVSDNTTVPLEVSTDCKDGYEFCIRNSDVNKQATIFGNYYDTETLSKYIVIEGQWCDTSLVTCPSYGSYLVQLSYSNFYKNKGGSVDEYKTRANFIFNNIGYTTNVTREIFTTNTRLFGHIANIFPATVQTYLYNNILSSVYILQTDLLTSGNYSTVPYFQTKIVPNKVTRQINENFDDISDIILFFFSVKETLFIIIFIIFIKQYNTNSGLLEVGSSLFYIDDPKNKRKYDFNQGYEVFIACLLHNHPATKLIHFLLTKTGRTFEDVFPNKAICAIKLMAKAEEMLQENAFYGNLNELSSMESQASRKIPLIEDDTNEQNEKEPEMSYFPFIPSDSEDMRKEKEIKREAFEQFCAANQYVSPKRKNFIYKTLTNSKLKYMLVHQLQKEFRSFVRNVRVQKSEDIYQEIEEEEFSQIKVAIHDSSNQHLTAQNFVRT